MHYGAYSFAKDRTKPTITPHDSDAEIGQRVKLSALDIERVQIFYECLKPVSDLQRGDPADHLLCDGLAS